MCSVSFVLAGSFMDSEPGVTVSVSVALTVFQGEQPGYKKHFKSILSF